MRSKYSFLIFLALISFYSHAQQWSGILDSDRAVNWSQAGIPGGIPKRTTVCATLSPGASSSQISSAISSCPAGQVVMLNAGSYNLSGAINFGGRDDVTLRGAGPDKTILNFSSGGSCTYGQMADVCIQGSFSWVNGPQHSTTWTGGYSKGSTQITLGTTSGLTVGQVLILDQDNDVSDTRQVFVCDSTGGAGSVECSTEGGSPGRTVNGKKRNQQQLVEVAGISGNTVTITPGIYMPNWRSSQNPGAWWATNVIQNSGIEDLTLNHTNSSGLVSGTLFFNAHKCWIKNVKSIYGHRNHVWIVQGSRVVVRDSYFYGTYNAQNLSYGVEPWMTSDLLIENNIFQHITSPVLLGNSQGSVVAYNYMTDIYSTNSGWLYPAIMAHDAGTAMNLFEGNQAPTAMEDAIHGTHNFATFFRNRFSGRDGNQNSQTVPIILMAYSRYANVVGNVLGTSGYHNTYSVNTGGSNSGCNTAIFNLGWSTAGCGNGSNANNGLPVPSDPLTVSTAMRWGNYDTVSNAARWNSSEVPSGLSLFANAVPSSQSLPASFYLSAKPSWWGSTNWPAVGPDVTGGPEAGGRVHYNPARRCFNSTAKDSIGVLAFDADNCYGTTTGSSAPPAPTSLNATIK